jgi:predicted O-methyltransferase YrrM
MTFSETDLPQLLVRRIRSAVASRSGSNTTQKDLADATSPTVQTASVEPAFFDAINLEEALSLYTAVRQLRPMATAEIGFCCGGSGLAILKAHADNGEAGAHWACDPYQTTYAKQAGLKNVAAAGLTERLRFYEAFPEEVVATFPRVQFAFIDASHLFDLSMLDFVLIDKKLDIGGVMAFHDLWMPSLQRLVRFILNNRGYQLYHPMGMPSVARPSGGRLRRTVAAVLRRLPRADRVFTQELLRPWTGFGIGNVVMLEKIHEDNRDWRHFARF